MNDLKLPRSRSLLVKRRYGLRNVFCRRFVRVQLLNDGIAPNLNAVFQQRFQNLVVLRHLMQETYARSEISRMSLRSFDEKYRLRTGERSAANELTAFLAAMIAGPPARLKGRRPVLWLYLLQALLGELAKRGKPYTC